MAYSLWALAAPGVLRRWLLLPTPLAPLLAPALGLAALLEGRRGRQGSHRLAGSTGSERGINHPTGGVLFKGIPRFIPSLIPSVSKWRVFLEAMGYHEKPRSEEEGKTYYTGAVNEAFAEHAARAEPSNGNWNTEPSKILQNRAPTTGCHGALPDLLKSSPAKNDMYQAVCDESPSAPTRGKKQRIPKQVKAIAALGTAA